MTILVTGGAGFIGGHTMLALREAGHDVIAFDNLSNGHEVQLCGAPLIKGDIRNADDLDHAFTSQKIDAVIHFAALIEAGRSVLEPDIFYDVNVKGTETLLAVMQRHGVKNIVFSSTAAVYGNPITPAIAEDHPRQPINPYGHTKAAVETLLEQAHQDWGLRYAALRYFNAAGGDPQARVGERHNPETHLIPLCIDAVLGKRPPIKLFGMDYDTPDGTCIRDYVHVSDLATAHVLALSKLSDTPIIANLGTGRGHSVRDVIAAVGRVMGQPVPYEAAARREGDPAILVCQAERARELLGWTPHYAELDTMVEHAVLFRRNV